MSEAIVDAFREGRVAGAPPGRPEYVRTILSHVFLFASEVYKMYRHHASMLEGTQRGEFYRLDFRWNQHFNPAVYLDLLGVCAGETVRICPADGAEDLVIRMQRVDTEENLTRELLRGGLAVPELRRIGRETARLVADFDEVPRLEGTWLEWLRTDVADLEGFMAEAGLPASEIAGVLRSEIEAQAAVFAAMPMDGLGPGIDCQSDNVFFDPALGTSFIDILPPRPEWRVMDPLLNVSRIAVDVRVLQGDAGADAVIDGYRDQHGPHSVEPRRQWLYELYGASVKWAYLLVMGAGRGAEAARYDAFVRQRIQQGPGRIV